MTQLGMFSEGGAAARAERGPTLAEARRDLMGARPAPGREAA